MLAGADFVNVPVDEVVVDDKLVTAPAWPAHPKWLAAPGSAGLIASRKQFADLGRHLGGQCGTARLIEVDPVSGMIFGWFRIEREEVVDRDVLAFRRRRTVDSVGS